MKLSKHGYVVLEKQRSRVLHFFQICHVLDKTCSFDDYVELIRAYIITFIEQFLSNAQKLRRYCEAQKIS